MARSISIHRTLAGLSVAVVAATIALTSVAGAADTSIEAETMALPAAAGQAFTDTQASGGAGLLIWTDGAATGALAATATSQLVVRARGDQCQGAPIMLVKVDGQVAGTVSVTATTWQDYPLAGTWATGSHQVSVAFVGDYRNGCDRNLRVDKLTFSATSGTPEPTPAATTKVEAESMALTPSAGQRFNDDTASGGAGLLVWSNGTATTMVTGTTGQLVIRARGDLCAGAPSMSVAIDGQPAGTVSVKSQTWQDYPVAWPNGTHRVDVAFTNDYLAACDRNLRLDVLTVTTGPPALTPTPTPTATPTPTPTPPPSSGNPFAGAREYVDPQSPAAEAAQARRTSDPAGAAALDKVAVGSKDDDGALRNLALKAQRVSKRIGIGHVISRYHARIPVTMSTKKVLAVVEDLFFTVKINESAKRAALPIVFVKSQRDALDQAAEHPSLIILDLNFASIDPLDLIRKLKADPALTKIQLLAYVSHVQGDLKQSAQEAGCDMVLARSAFSQNLLPMMTRQKNRDGA